MRYSILIPSWASTFQTAHHLGYKTVLMLPLLLPVLHSVSVSGATKMFWCCQSPDIQILQPRCRSAACKTQLLV